MVNYDKKIEKTEDKIILYWYNNLELYGTIKLTKENWVYEIYGDEFKSMWFLESFFKHKGDKGDGLSMLLFLKEEINSSIFTFTFIPKVHNYLIKNNFAIFKQKYIHSLDYNVSFLFIN